VSSTRRKAPGGVNVLISMIYVPENDKLDDYLAEWKRTGGRPSRLKKGMYIPPRPFHGMDENGYEWALQGDWRSTERLCVSLSRAKEWGQSDVFMS